jgi:RES domain
VSRVAESAVAESIQSFRGQTLHDGDFRLVGGEAYALATFDDSAVDRLVDLDDPMQLASRQLRPSMVATHDRTVTRQIALRIFEEGVLGLCWWSTLEATWPNVTLFAERASPFLTFGGSPELLSVRHPVVRTAAQSIGVLLA